MSIKMYRSGSFRLLSPPSQFAELPISVLKMRPVRNLRVRMKKEGEVEA
jgi:hypothetical protein